ncbi:MAG TPA: LCP family protein [Candidatus Peribacteraceae bacterium]|nr:LCP family protein [Candidatus Peribacteraceae bacterium]
MTKRVPHAVPSQPDIRSLIMRIALLGSAGLLILLLVIVVPLSIPAMRMTAVRTVLAMAGAAPPHDSHGYTNVLLLGTGDKNHDGADLTDTMILASIDPSTRSVLMLSIPRDLYLSGNKDVPDGRINSLYVYYKGHERFEHPHDTDDELTHLALTDTADAISVRFGIPIQGVIKADFTAFVNAVNALGGVDVVVQKPITDYSYPIKEGVTGLFHMDAGPAHLDGETALKFARSRHGGTDFDRSQRQQQLIDAMSLKLKNMSRVQQIEFVSSFWESVLSHVQTTFSTQEILGLTQIGTELSTQEVISAGINFNAGSDYQDSGAGGFLHSADPALYQGADVLLPTTLPTDSTGWKQLQTYAGFLVYHRDLYLAHQHMQVINQSANALAAYRLENEIRRYGFIVDPAPKAAANAKTKKPLLAQSFVTFQEDDDKHVASFFGTLLGMNVSQQSADPAEGTGAAVRIILGKDYKYQPFEVIGTGSIVEK